MTVSYQYDVASSTSGGFTRLLLKWKGSLYKLIYREMIAFLLLFVTVSLLYRFVLTEPQQRYFEVLVRFFERYLEMIPLSFVLGFYVTTIATRWWQQYVALPWPDKYYDKRELERFQSVQTEFNTYWIPSCWFVDLLRECRTKKKIIDPPGMRLIMEEFLDIRSKCSLLWSYDWISIPLVYTQVVTLATYTFYLACVVARQNVIGDSPDTLEIDDYFPVFTIFQLLFYMGLLKVAEQMINPFGDDDEDFELNFLIDRHTKVSYLVVDLIHQNSPPIEKDLHFDEIDPTLPYTEASVHHKKDTYKGSAADMVVPQKKQTLSIPVSVDESIDEESSMRSFAAHREEYRGHTLESIAERLGHAKNSFARKPIQRTLSASSRNQENCGFENDYTLESGLRAVTTNVASVLPDPAGLQPRNNLSSSSPCSYPVSKRKYSTNQRPSLFQSQMLSRVETEGGDSDSNAIDLTIGDRPVPMRRSKRDCKSPVNLESKSSVKVEEDKESNLSPPKVNVKKLREEESDDTDLEDDGL